ncbi:hypothetical protein C8R44DRAFT_738161 [Mycena epipterygia]|nr:hypothetical protein C8R44DRAFT_738161 [Mycena epipterygia]
MGNTVPRDRRAGETLASRDQIGQPSKFRRVRVCAFHQRNGTAHEADNARYPVRTGEEILRTLAKKAARRAQNAGPRVLIGKSTTCACPSTNAERLGSKRRTHERAAGRERKIRNGFGRKDPPLSASQSCVSMEDADGRTHRCSTLTHKEITQHRVAHEKNGTCSLAWMGYRQEERARRGRADDAECRSHYAGMSLACAIVDAQGRS